jgi:hypothetical protein
MGTNPNVLFYTRVKGSSKVIVAINLSSKVQSTTVKLGSTSGNLYRFATGAKVKVASTHKFTVGAGSYEIYSTNLVK